MARLHPGVILVLVIIFVLLANPSSRPVSKTEVQHLKAAIAEERKNLQTLSNSTYGDFTAHDSASVNWLNLTGLRKEDNYAWALLDPFKKRAIEQVERIAGKDGLKILQGEQGSQLLLYKNVTGSVRGQWVKSTLHEGFLAPTLNLSALSPDIYYLNTQWGRNITGSSGKVSLRLKEATHSKKDLHNTKDTSGVTARATIQDESSSANGWTSTLHGVHYHQLGAMLLTTTSEKFAGIFALPHFAISQHLFDVSKNYSIESLNRTIQNQERDYNDAVLNPWTSIDVNEEEPPSSPMCEMVLYLQQFPVESPYFDVDGTAVGDNQAMLELLEKDLRYPRGGTFPPAPSLKMSMIIFSPDCGFVLESKDSQRYGPEEGRDLEGVKAEVRVRSMKNALVMFIFVLVAQILLLLGQIKAASTPSTRSRISFYTMAMLSMSSTFHALVFLFVSSIMDSIFVLSFVTAFLAFTDGLFFAMKFLLDIWIIQEPERLEERRRRRQRETVINQAQEPHSQTATTNIEPTQSLPLPATTGDTGATPIIIPSDQDATTMDSLDPDANPRQSFGVIYTRYCMLLLAIVFCSIWAASSWPATLRSVYANSLAFVFVSFWVPQIYRNVVRHCRKALSFRFIAAQSVLRLAPLAYFWGVEENVLFIETDVRMLQVFAGWLWIQIVVLKAQEIVGPRFLVSERWSWVPPAWDYHRILREDEEGATLPLGLGRAQTNDETGPSTLGSGTEKSSQKGKKIFDCAICMQKIEVPVIPADSALPERTGDSSLLSPAFLGRRSYMITPCRHIFHNECLEGWIDYRLQCPICRESLPPL